MADAGENEAKDSPKEYAEVTSQTKLAILRLAAGGETPEVGTDAIVTQDHKVQGMRF